MQSLCRASTNVSRLTLSKGICTNGLPFRSALRPHTTLQTVGGRWTNNVILRNVERLSLGIASRYCTEVPKQTGKKAVGIWLATCTGMVFGAVILGGVTRLTESGLSMVTWKLLGEKRPRTEEAWIAEFEKYKEFPEFKYKNSDMTLSEFKRIWWMEYLHRQWGRCIGAVFALPAMYFWSKGYFSKAMKNRVLVFGTLIGLQGLMGWYMVKSGLEDRFQGPNDVPRVSQYRLAAHLSLAFLLYTFLISATFAHLRPVTKQPLHLITRSWSQFRKLALYNKAIVFWTALSGAFVAGLDAGLVYNSWPKMGDKWIPEEILDMKPKYKNFTENPVTVQFDHRLMGYATLSFITGLWLYSRRLGLPPAVQRATNVLFLMGWAQVLLGITTLLHHVPVPLAASHQSGSLLVLTCAFWLTHELKAVKYLPK